MHQTIQHRIGKSRHPVLDGGLSDMMAGLPTGRRTDSGLLKVALRQALAGG
jgi:hypothetical protein